MADMNGIWRTLASIQQRIAQASRHGVVAEVKDGKIRVAFGYRADGKPHLGPWIFPGQHNGVKREDVPFRKGQNVTIEMPTGDPRQARALPYGPNDENPRPVHASEDAATVQFPHFDKDGKEEKDKDKPGFQRTENSKERSTEFDKISKSTQTKTNQTQTVLDKVNGKSKSIIDQTHAETSRKLEDRQGNTSSLAHTAKEVLHKVGDIASHSHTKEGFKRVVGNSTLQHLADKVLHSVGGGASSLLDAGKHLFDFGGHSALTSAAGTKFLGGLVQHDGKDIGATHTHDVLTRFGSFLTSVPKAVGGGSGGGGGGGGGGPVQPPDGNETLSDALPFAWGGFERTVDGVIVLRGRQFGLAFTDLGDGHFRADFPVPTPHGDNQYRVMYGQNGPLTIRIINQDPQAFWFEYTEGTGPFRVWFIIMP